MTGATIRCNFGRAERAAYALRCGLSGRPQRMGELAVFGMLDYRAHKLFFLFMLPLWLTSKISYYLCIAVGILIARSTGYDFWPKVIIAYACTELLAAVVLGVWWAINLLAQKLFFWIVDVIPAKGDNDEEAKEIAKRGRLIWLVKKFSTDVQNWNYEDTNALASTLNWRARMFFNIKDRIKQRTLIFQQHWEETGKQPGDLTQVERNELIGHLEDGWFEKLIVNQYYFNSLVAVVIILVTLNALR
jgi:hypothetical protein